MNKMANPQQFNASQGKASRDVSEKFAETLRKNQLDEFSSDCPYAACLFPLLKALGWKSVARELIEALPHFADDIDLVDLRNILVNIGYESFQCPYNLTSCSQNYIPIFLWQNREKSMYCWKEQMATLNISMPCNKKLFAVRNNS